MKIRKVERISQITDRLLRKELATINDSSGKPSEESCYHDDHPWERQEEHPQGK